MEHEGKKPGIPQEPAQPIQLVLNDEEDGIRLSNVFYHMKRRRRVFVWVLVLCLTVGFCAPLLLYQFTKPQLTVSSVVTLQYEAPVKVPKTLADDTVVWVVPEHPEYAPVTDLSAPDGTDLDLNQITSSYVLQNALNGLTLSQPITASNLRANITIQTVMTEESRRTQESLAGLAEIRNAGAYTGLKDAEIKYENRFVVSLTNGFTEEGNEDALFKKELRNDELQMVLDRVLTVYNDYLVKTYADVRLPEDVFSVIDAAEMDVLESLEQLRAGLDGLETYGKGKSESVQEYRSWKTGRTLVDWMETLKAYRTNEVDYLYALVAEDAITRDRSALLTTYRYLAREAKSELEKVNGEIEETGKVLAQYKHDELYITMQESESSRNTTLTSDYYNQKMLQQTENYDRAAALKTKVANLNRIVTLLEGAEGISVTEAVEQELERTLSTARGLYAEIREHMDEVFESPLYTTYARHSVPQGKEQNFLVASWKRILLGVAAGLAIGFVLWFVAGIVPEMGKGRKEETHPGKEVTVE